MSRELQYQFDLEIHRVYIEIPFVCTVQVWWKRGNKKISTKKPINLTGQETFFDVNQKLSIMANCHLRDNLFQSKDSTIEVVIFITEDQKVKTGGSYTFQMTEIISPNSLTKPVSKNYDVYLQNCPPNTRKISFTLFAKYIQDTPQNQHDISFQGSTFVRNTEMTFRIPEQKPSIKQRPMEFSFSPVNPIERQKVINYTKKNQDQSQTIADLRKILQEREDELSHKQLELNKLKAKLFETQKRETKNNSEKILSLMNQLNTALSQNQLLKKQKAQANSNLNRMRQEKNEILTNYAKIKDDYHFERNEMSNRFELKKKQVQSLKKQNDDIKNQIFKKQSQLINLQNKYQKIVSDSEREKSNFVRKNDILKDQTEKLQELSETAKQLKINYDRLRREKEEQQKQYQAIQQTINLQQQTIQALKNHIAKSQTQYNKEREALNRNYYLLQTKFKQKQTLIYEIQKEFQHINSQKQTITKQKDQELTSLRQKFNLACKKIDQLAEQLLNNQKSFKIQVSQLKVQITTLQGICGAQEQTIQEKQNLISKAKQYINDKQEELSQRNQFINKAKNYIQGKENQLNHCKHLIKQLQDKIKQSKDSELEKQQQMALFVNNKSQKDQRIKQLQNIVRMLEGKIDSMMDQFQEMNRRNKSHQETLQQLVRKNLDMEIQLSIKNYQLNSAAKTTTP